MSTYKDNRAELDHWADIWADMEQENIHPPTAPKQPQQMSDFAASMLGEPESPSNDDDFDFYSAELFAEENIPNPVYPDSVGADSEGPEAVWVNEKLLDEVQKLKDQLFKVENEMARLGQSKKFSEKPVEEQGKKLMDVIESIRKRIDKVSDQIGIKDEPSPYKKP